MRLEVCCIPAENAAYQQLVRTAWVAAYLALEQVNERTIVVMVSVLKAMPNDEALALRRRGFENGEGREEIDKAYTQFLSRR